MKQNIHRNSALEGYRREILIGVMIMFILFLGSFVSAPINNTKSYNPSTKEITIKNSGLDIAKVKLNTPVDNHVGLGYQKVAEFEVNSYSNYAEAIKTIELYNLKDKSRAITRKIDFKYKTSKDVDVDDYKNECYENQTTGKETCINIISGSHIESVEAWKELSSMDMKAEKLTIGLFTDVQIGDKVEWIPNLFGVRVTEWAVWTADLNTNLIAYYNFDEGTGTNLDDKISHGYNGTLLNSPIWEGGILGGALNFSSSSFQLVNITNSTFGFGGENNFSINVWIYPNRSVGDNTIIGKEKNWMLYQAGLKIYLYLTNGGAYANSFSTTNNVLNTGAWQMVTVVYNGTGNAIGASAEIYVNGTSMPVTKAYTSGTFTNSEGQFNIGVNNGVSDFYNGGIDELGIWNRTLTLTEVTQLYNGGIGLEYSTFYPTISLNSPVDNYNSTSLNIIFNCTASDPINLTNVSLYINGIINATNSSGFNNSDYIFPVTMPYGNHNWTCEGCNNASICVSATVRLLNVGLILENSQAYSPTTIEGSNETFIINMNYDSTYYPNLIGTLIYDGVSYAGIRTGSGDNAIFTRQLYAPSVTSDTIKSFHWNIYLVHNSTTIDYYNSTAINQTVYNIELGNCNGTYTYPLFNLTMKDEDTRIDLNGTSQNTSLDSSIVIYTLGRTINLLNLSTNYSKINPVEICLSRPINNSYYSLDATFKYSVDDYVTEYYNIQNLNITNSTIPQVISLYDLLATRSQEFLITYKDANFVPQGDILIEITRQYLSLGQFLTVEIPKTDSDGRTVGHFVLNDEVYTIYAKKDGVLLGTWSNVRAFCSNVATGDCRINLNAISSNLNLDNFMTGLGVSFTEAYNDTTKIYTFQYISLDGTTKTIDVNITDYHTGAYVCGNSLASSSGILNCVIPSTSYNSTILIRVYVDGTLLTSSAHGVLISKSSFLSTSRYILAFFLIITISLLAISSGVMMLMFFIIGLITISLLFLVDSGGYFGGLSAIFWFIIAGIILIWKATRRKE